MRTKANRATRVRIVGAAAITVSIAAIAIGIAMPGLAQVAPPTGQNVVPVYEGWERRPDGSFNLVFGYFNRNWAEEIDVPIGAGNRFEPGPDDQGQPTHFLPRRNRFLFRIQVPKDFGTKELVWTLTSNGKPEQAYATLKPDYFIDDVVIMNNEGAGGTGGGGYNINLNKAPSLMVDGARSRTVKVGEPIAMVATGKDDGLPKRRIIRAPMRVAPNSASGLRLAWFVYRGPAANVTFDPPQFEVWEDHRDNRNSPWSTNWGPPPVPADGTWKATVTFSRPGTYVLRCQLHDGGLLDDEDITFVVQP